MVLTLEVTSPQAASLGRARRRVFRAEGGSIGRQPDSNWMLPDPGVSRRHALITYRHDTFYIEDAESAGGVYVNSSTRRLQRGQQYALKSGDSVRIEPYEIRVSITPDPEAADDRRDARSDAAQGDGLDDLFGEPAGAAPHDDPFAPAGSQGFTPRAQPSGQDEGLGPVSGEELDPLKLLDPGSKPVPVRDEIVVPPRVAQREVVPIIPADYDPLADLMPSTAPPEVTSNPPTATPANTSRAAHDESPIEPVLPEPRPPVPPPTPSPAAAPATLPSASSLPVPSEPARVPTGVEVKAGGPQGARPASRSLGESGSPVSTAGGVAEASSWAALLEGAGLDPAAVTPELARSFGRILRVVVSGVMDVLQARHQTKDVFQMRMTYLRPVDNNPLKFSANVDDALFNLLVKRNPAYLAPVEAFEDAFDDLRNHQIATLAGMRVAFESTLAEFAPDRLQERFDRESRRGWLPGLMANSRYWDLYRDFALDLARDPEASFRRLFGDEFAKAYEEQLERLKAAGRSGPVGDRHAE